MKTNLAINSNNVFEYQVDNGRVITMSDKPILKAFHDNFYFLDANDYIDK